MKKNLFLAILGIAILVSISETIFQLNNNPSIQFRIQPYLARFFIISGLPEQAFQQIGKVADYKLQNTNLKVSESLNVPNLSKNRELKKMYVVFLDENKNDLLNSMDYNFWSKTFYRLGILAYQYNEPELFESFLQSAINFSPQWSYFHIELANYYLINGKKEKSEENLKKCIELIDPSRHCQQFYDYNFTQELTEEVGFLEKTIEKL